MNLKKLSLLVLTLTISAGITYYFVVKSETSGLHGAFEGADGARDTGETIMAVAYGFSITLIGVFLGAIYRRLDVLRQEGIPRVRFLSMIDEVMHSPDFLMAVVGAPLIFGLIWEAIVDGGFSAYTIIALQNGFAANALSAQFSKPGALSP